MLSSGRPQSVCLEGLEVGARHGRSPRRLAWTAAILAVLAMALVLVHPPVAAVVMLGAVFAALSRALALRRFDRGEGTLTITSSAMAVERSGKRLELPWSSVARWELRPRGDHEELLVEGMDGDAVVAVLHTEEQSAAVVAAARLAEARRTMTVKLVPAARTWREVALVLLAVAAAVVMNSQMDASGSTGAGVACMIAALAAIAWLVRLRDVARVVVGIDGVVLVRGGALAFVPYSAIWEVDWDECGVILRLKDGTEFALPVVSAEGLRDTRNASVARMLARRDALHERVRTELARWRTSVGVASDRPGAALLDRQGRSLSAWRAGLRDLVTTAGLGYRHVAMDREEVARIVEDPRAPVERRVAAAMALAPDADPGLRARVRAVVDACALDPVRVAIDRAVSGDLDEVTLDVALVAAGERGLS